jgi:hypothetical protein
LAIVKTAPELLHCKRIKTEKTKGKEEQRHEACLRQAGRCYTKKMAT